MVNVEASSSGFIIEQPFIVSTALNASSKGKCL